MAKIKEPVTWKPGDISSTDDSHWRDAKGGIVKAQSLAEVIDGNNSSPQICVARRKVIPCNRRIDVQQSWRWNQSSLIRLWRALPVGSVNAWNWFAAANSIIDKYGNTDYLNGFDWFCKLNGRLIHANTSTLTDPPPDSTPSYNPVFSFYQILAGTGIYIGVDTVPTGSEKIVVSCRLNRPVTSYTSIYPYIFRENCTSIHVFPHLVIPIPELVFDTTRSFFRGFPIDEYGRTPGDTLESVLPVS